MLKTKLISSLKIGVTAGLATALFEALLGGIDNVDYFHATFVGVVVTIVFFLFRLGSSENSSQGKL